MKQTMQIVDDWEPGKKYQSVSWNDSYIHFMGYQMTLNGVTSNRLMYCVTGRIDLERQSVSIDEIEAVIEPPVDKALKETVKVDDKELSALKDFLWREFFPLIIGDKLDFYIEQGGHA